MEYLVPNAEQSPRITNGIIYWYENDTFDIELKLELVSEDGEDIKIASSDIVEIVFTSRLGRFVKKFSFTEIEDNTVKIDMDASASILFPKGQYRYDVYYIADDRVTIANDNEVVVQ